MTRAHKAVFPFFASLILIATAALGAEKNPGKVVILVDKKTNTLRVSRYEAGTYQLIKQFHSTIGKVQGDKEEEGDLKTPEGIYIFDGKQSAPKIAPKLGQRSFHLNYPNSFDILAGRTGSNILLHATNEPERLKKDYDSEGCVVVNDEEILEIEPYIRVGLTPILIFNELTEAYSKPAENPTLKAFFESWIRDWENKNAVSYIDHYHSDFVFRDRGNMSRESFLKYKEGLNKIYATIKVDPQDVMYLTHPKYSVISFTQNYRSTLKSGGAGHVSRGTKLLYIAEEAGKPKIVAEAFSRLLW